MTDFIEEVIEFVTQKEVYGTVLTIVISCLIYKVIAALLEKALNANKEGYELKKRKTVVILFQRITKYLIVIIAGLNILSIFGVNVKGMVAGLGVTATIIGLALQDTFKDIISGINIITENYFIVGDIVSYNGFTGEVIEFGLKSTKIKNVNGEVMIVANRNIMELKNLSQKDQTVQIKIPLPYGEDIGKLEEIINNQILPQIKEVENVTPETVVYLGINELADSSVNYLVQFRCRREKQWQAKRDANKIILETLNKNKVSVPFPQVEVHNGK